MTATVPTRLSGVALVAQHEFQLRLRTGRWRWLLGGWFVVVTLFTALLKFALTKVGAEGPDGVPMFGALMLWVLALSLLVSPALSAQAINGDRDRGTLATLQVTRLTATEIAAGKLLAAWGTSGVFLALTLPDVVWSIAEGGVGIGRAVAVLAVVLVLCGVICALALALSALLARGITSAVLSYLVVFALTVGTVVAFGLATALTTSTETRTSLHPKDYRDYTVSGVKTPTAFCHQRPEQCATRTYTTTAAHPERVWWLLAPNPFVVLADSAPQLPLRRDPVTGEVQPRALDPLGGIGMTVREIRAPGNESGVFLPGGQARSNAPPVWPWGLGFDVLLGAGALVLTARRLRAPVYRLPRGVRIA